MKPPRIRHGGWVDERWRHRAAQRTRAADLQRAIASDGRPASMLRPVTFAMDDDESELRRVPMRPMTGAEEAADVW